ncbi:hypothetical protein Tco_0810906 [Tanacetum coccineum]
MNYHYWIMSAECYDRSIMWMTFTVQVTTEEEEPSEGSNETEPFEDDETDVTPPPPGHHEARIYIRPQTPMAASTHALIVAFAAGSPLFALPPTSPTYD